MNTAIKKWKKFSPLNLPDITGFFDNPRITPPNCILEGAAVGSWNNRHVNFSRVLPLTYISNFSVGADGWTSLSNVVVTGNVDNIGGEDDTLRIFANAVLGTHVGQRLATFTSTLGSVYQLTFRYFMPSGQTIVDSFAVLSGLLQILEINPAIFDVWTEVTIKFMLPPVPVLEIQLLNGGVPIFVGANSPLDDRIYLKDVVVTEIRSDHLTNTLSTFKPTFSGNTIICNGVDQELHSNQLLLDGIIKCTIHGRVKSLVGTSFSLGQNFDVNFRLGVFNSGGTTFFLVENTGVTFGSFVDVLDNNFHDYDLIFDGSLVGNINRLKGFKDGIQQVLAFTGIIPAIWNGNIDKKFYIGVLNGGIFVTGDYNFIACYNNQAFEQSQINDLVRYGESLT